MPDDYQTDDGIPRGFLVPVSDERRMLKRAVRRGEVPSQDPEKPLAKEVDPVEDWEPPCTLC